MKKIYFLMALTAFISACSGGDQSIDSNMVENSRPADQPEVDPNQLASIEFEETNINLGKVYEGESVSQIFKFKNTGKSPLVINTASASCGCTKPEYPRAPIAPGAEGELKVTFNSEGKVGANHKEVTVFANTDPRQTVISFDIEVIQK
jgi:hypothetical protein